MIKFNWPNWEHGTDLLKDKAFKHKLPSVVSALIIPDLNGMWQGDSNEAVIFFEWETKEMTAKCCAFEAKEMRVQGTAVSCDSIDLTRSAFL